MSITISKDNIGRNFVLKLQGIRKKETVKNLEEVTASIAHYFSIEPQHSEYKSQGKCPLCDAER